ncbi:MAG TPA: PKD domain-containing protein, partial [Flavisolibacter sp.]
DGTTSTARNPVHLFNNYGTFTVTLITTNGDCADTARRNITIRDLTPDFNAAVREGCRPFTASINAVVPDPGLVQSYIWDFGDGTQQNFGTSPVATHTYSSIGNYDIRLTTIDTFGCSHTVLKNDFIRINGPTANFTSSSNTGCKGLVTTFTDASTTDGINKIVRWKWDFGDGTVQTFTQGPFTHQYDSIADYDVKLVVTDEKGCTDSISYLAFVKLSSITANWSTPGETCPGAPISFRNNSKSDFPYTSVWSFGDGQSLAITDPAASQDAFHVYADTALYTVKLKVRDLFGCEDSLSKVNIVKVSLPVASFDVNAFITYCTPFEAKFKNTSTFYTTSSWSFGAGQGTSTLRDPSNFYTQKGVYEVKLEVRSPGGCKDDTTQIITVNTPADGNITYSPLSGCKPAVVSFDAFTRMNARFIWDFGDGNVVDTNTNVIQHVYTDFGTFIPRIILQELGTTCSFPVTGVQPINLLGVTTKYTIDKQFFCDSGLVTILDSTTYNDAVTEYKWDFGDGTTFNAPNPGSHTYKNPGIYNISLIVNTQAGCTDTLMKGPIKIVESPLIAVETDTVICVNDTLRHLGLFQRTDTSAVTWLWQFPNGNSSTLQNPPVQKYPTAGSFVINTIATNSSGCADTVTKSLLVNPLPVITLAPTLTKFVGVPITLPATYSRNTVSYTWTPATSLSCTDCPQPVSETKFNRSYTVTVIDSNSCVNTDVVQVIVLCQGNKLFMPNTFSPNGDGTNDMFYPRGTGLDRVKSLRIFNRWGEVVFEQRDFPTNNAAFGWNGTYKGKKALPDVYIYQAEIFCENSEIIRFEGNIALIQ